MRSAETVPTGAPPVLAAAAIAATVMSWTALTRGYCATSVASAVVTRLMFWADFVVTEPVVGSTVRTICPMRSP